jgi:hypothetical protein
MKQPESLELADLFDRGGTNNALHNAAAKELRRLHEAHEWQHKMAGQRLRRIEKLDAINQELVEALETIAEYWDQDTNHDAMQDACYYMEATARVALAKARGEA